MTTYNCEQVRSRLSSSLDGTLSGREMQRMAEHTKQCGMCAAEFSELGRDAAVARLAGHKKAPADLDCGVEGCDFTGARADGGASPATVADA